MDNCKRAQEEEKIFGKIWNAGAAKWLMCAYRRAYGAYSAEGEGNVERKNGQKGR